MMAWIRTATSLISFGFTIYKFFDIEKGLAKPANRLIGPREFSLIVVGVGLISLLLGTVEHRRGMRSLHAECPGLPRSPTSVLAAMISILGILALVAIIFRQ
jgi:putative membrane protein